MTPLSPNRVKVLVHGKEMLALLDSGASVSLIRDSFLKTVTSSQPSGPTIVVQDCHSNLETTAGEVQLSINILDTSNPVHNAVANLQSTENLSSELLLGCDF